MNEHVIHLDRATLITMLHASVAGRLDDCPEDERMALMFFAALRAGVGLADFSRALDLEILKWEQLHGRFAGPEDKSWPF